MMSALEKLKQLEPIQFRYKKEFDPDCKLRAGFSAQQVQKIIPEAVVEEDGVLMLDMDVLHKYMREAKEELKAKNS
tara:strand:- start:2838 stop:3065 length:228 start_codon:yes stop_codon:yes gene_type:complete